MSNYFDLLFAIDYLLVSFVTIAITSAILAYNSPKTIWQPGSAGTRWESLSAPPDPLAAKPGLLLRGREGKEEDRMEGRGREGRGKEGRERASVTQIPGSAPETCCDCPYSL